MSGRTCQSLFPLPFNCTTRCRRVSPTTGPTASPPPVCPGHSYLGRSGQLTVRLSPRQRIDGPLTCSLRIGKMNEKLIASLFHCFILSTTVFFTGVWTDTPVSHRPHLEVPTRQPQSPDVRCGPGRATDGGGLSVCHGGQALLLPGPSDSSGRVTLRVRSCQRGVRDGSGAGDVSGVTCSSGALSVYSSLVAKSGPSAWVREALMKSPDFYSSH